MDEKGRTDEDQRLIQRLGAIKIKGRDKRGQKVVMVIGKLLCGRLITVEAMKRYLEEKIYTAIEGERFCVVYFHTEVQRSSFPRVYSMRAVYEAVPASVKEKIDAIYVVHPGLQARIFFATFGRFLFGSWLYQKVKFMNRVEFLWENVRRKEMEIPEFIYKYDEEIERPPLMDYGIESDHARSSYSFLDYSSTHPLPPLFSLRSIS